MKKFLALFLSCVLLLTMIPASVFADETVVEVNPDDAVITEDLDIEIVEVPAEEVAETSEAEIIEAPEEEVTETSEELTETSEPAEEVTETSEPAEEVTEPSEVETPETSEEPKELSDWEVTLDGVGGSGELTNYITNETVTLDDVGDKKYNETEPNGTKSQAGVVYHDYTIYGTTTSGGYDLDYFAFTLSKSTYVEIIAGATKSSLAMLVYKSTSDSAIGSDYIDTVNGDSYIGGLTGTLSAGTYYVCVLDGNNAANTYVLYFDLGGTTNPDPTPTPTPTPPPTEEEEIVLTTPVVSAAYDSATQTITVSWDEVDGATAYYISYTDPATGNTVSDYIYDCYYEVTSLVPGGKYVFSVQAWNDTSSSDFGTATVRAGADFPILEYTKNQAGQVVLEWNPVNGATLYEVYRAVSGTASFTKIGITPALFYADASAVLGTNYDYYVAAVGGTTSNYVTAFRSLAAVTDVTATNVASTGKVKLSWTAVEGAVSYKVLRATSIDGSYSTMKSGITGTTYTNASAVAGKTYYYKIMAVAANTAANSAYCDPVEAVCDLAQPTITLGNNATSGKVTVKWEKVTNAVKYQVYRATSKTGTYKLQKTVTTLNWTDTNSTAGKTYYYKVRAVASNTAANSAFSAIKSRLTDCAKPVIKVSASSTSSITVKWDKVTGAAKYQVWRATSKDGTYKRLTTTTSTSYKNTGLTAGKTYYYKVKAIASNTNANSQFSDILTAKATVNAPTLKKSATVTLSSIKISWNKVSGANGYYVYRRPSSSNTWTKVKTITSGSTTSFENKDIKAGNYYYCVEAYKTVSGKKHASVKSDAIRVRTLAKPTLTYSRTRDEDNNGGYQLSWKKITGATGYQLQCKVDGDDSWTTVHTATSGSDTSIWLPTSKYGYSHTFRVRAIYKNNGVTSTGAYSKAVDAGFWYWNPQYSTWMSTTTYSNTTGTLIEVTNKGTSTMRFYSSGGKWIDKDYYTYDRNCALYDYSQYYYYNKKVKVNYVDIKPGETKVLLVMVTGNPTWYDKYTTIQLKCRYNNQYFITKTSSQKCTYSWDSYAG